MTPEQYPDPAAHVVLPPGRTLENLVRAKRDAEAALLSRAGVTGIDVGLRRRGGQRTNEACIRIHVKAKRPLADLAPDDVLPAAIDGISTDIIERDIARPIADTGTYRPLIGGISIGPLTASGTLTAIVRDRSTHDLLLLSNAHVFYYDWYTSGTVGSDGRELQPGGADAGFTTVGTRLRYVYQANDPAQTGIDAAVASIAPIVNVDGQIAQIGAVAGTADPQLGSAVRKRGRTTGLTSGTIEAIDATVVTVGPAFTVARQYHQVLATADSGSMIEAGDSGSPLVDGSNRLVAILGTDAGGSVSPPVASATVAGGAPISAVLDALGVDVYVGGVAGTAGNTDVPPPPVDGGGGGGGGSPGGGAASWEQGDVGAQFLESGDTPATDFGLRVDGITGSVTNSTLETPPYAPRVDQVPEYQQHLPSYVGGALTFTGYATLGGINVEDPPGFPQFPADSDLSGPRNAGIAPWGEMPELHQWPRIGAGQLHFLASIQFSGPCCFLRAFELRHSPYERGASWQLDRRELFSVWVEANGAISVKTTATPSGYAETTDTIPPALVGQVMGAAISAAGAIPFDTPIRLQVRVLLDTGLPGYPGAFIGVRVGTTTVLGGSGLSQGGLVWTLNPYPASALPVPPQWNIDSGRISGVDFGAVEGAAVTLRDLLINANLFADWLDNWAVDTRLVASVDHFENDDGLIFPFQNEVLAGGVWSGSDEGASRISPSYPMLALSGVLLNLDPLLPAALTWDGFRMLEGRSLAATGRRNFSDFHVPISGGGEQWWMDTQPSQAAAARALRLPLAQERRKEVMYPLSDWKYFRGQPGQDGVEHGATGYSAIGPASFTDFPWELASSFTGIEINYAHAIALRTLSAHLFHVPQTLPGVLLPPEPPVPPTHIFRNPLRRSRGWLWLVS